MQAAGSLRTGEARRPIRASVDSRPMKTILVVDDAPNIVELPRLYLEGAGYAPAVELHRKHRPDLVILDLMLPGMDGFEVCRAIRREADTPVLMLTARTDD